MQGIFQKENTDKALKYGIYRHLPTYEKIIRNLVSFSFKSLPPATYNICHYMYNIGFSFVLKDVSTFVVSFFVGFL
jgi:hypothetical protein